MAIFSLAVLTSNLTAGSCTFELIGSSTTAYKLLELGLTNNAATAGTFGYGRPAATGGTPTTPVTVLAEDAGNTTAGNSNTALAWATAPTTPAAFLRRIGLPATIGAGIIWTFPRGITCLKTISTALWVVATAGALNLWCVVDE